MNEDIRNPEFVAKSYLRAEVYKSLDRSPSGVIAPLTEEAAIAEGDTVYLPWVTGGFLNLTVEKAEGRFYGRSGLIVVPLAFGADKRGCWTALGFASVEAGPLVLKPSEGASAAPVDHQARVLECKQRVEATAREVTAARAALKQAMDALQMAMDANATANAEYDSAVVATPT